MPSASHIIERLPSLYRPEPDATDLLMTPVRAIGSGIDGISGILYDAGTGFLR